jgi:hypothetical protein
MFLISSRYHRLLLWEALQGLIVYKYLQFYQLFSPWIQLKRLSYGPILLASAGVQPNLLLKVGISCYYHYLVLTSSDHASRRAIQENSSRL